MAVSEAPRFGHNLKDIRLDEGQSAHFETTLTPVNDASMKVINSWFIHLVNDSIFCIFSILKKHCGIFWLIHLVNDSIFAFFQFSKNIV